MTELKYLHNQKGYALLLILLMIMLFVSVAAVITNASFNHSNQEIALDSNNQVIVAAEMGVKYYSTEIQSIADQVRKTIMIDTVQPLLDSYELKYNECNSEGFVNPSCNPYKSLSEFVNYVNLVSKNLFISRMEDQLAFFTSTDTKDITDKLGFELLEIQPIIGTEGTVSFSVEGKNIENNSEVLISEMTINTPNFLTTHQNLNESASDIEQWNAMLLAAPFAEQSCFPGSNITAPYICQMGDKSLQEIINSGAPLSILNQLIVINSTNSDLCSKSGNCGIDMKGMTVYNQTSVDLGTNFNNTSNGTFYNNGYFRVDNNLQNLDANIVTTSMEVKNFKNITGKVLILGTPEKTGTASFQNVSVKDAGKLCINLDGLNSFTFGQLNGTADQIIFYSSNKNPQYGRTIFAGSYQEFLQSCSPHELNLPFPSLDENEFEITVNYN